MSDPNAISDPTPTATPPAGETVAGAPERPPLGSWGRMYLVVLGALAAEIVLFYLFTRAFS